MINASVSIGIKIKLSDLLTQLNETNYDLIIKMLISGFIEHNKCKDYTHLLDSLYDDNLLEKYNYIEIKEILHLWTFKTSIFI